MIKEESLEMNPHVMSPIDLLKTREIGLVIRTMIDRIMDKMAMRARIGMPIIFLRVMSLIEG
jgi:hypothetical protein